MTSEVESLLPDGFDARTPEELFQALERLDEAWKERVETAAGKNQKLRYIARLEQGKLDVRVRSVDVDSPFVRPNGRENVVAFTTDRYKDTPMVIQGPGAGLGVTSAGLLADLILAAELMP